MTADIVTAKACGYGGSGTPHAIDPTDTFARTAGRVYAVFHLHNLPQGATADVQWNFPSGQPYAYQSSYPIFCAYVDTGAPGQYNVTVHVNGKTVGSHDFTVAGKSTPSSGPSARVAQSSNGKSHGQGRAHNHNPKGPKGNVHGPKGNNNNDAVIS